MTTYTITITTDSTTEPIVQLTVSEETARYCTFWSALQNIVKEHLGRPTMNTKMPSGQTSDTLIYGPGPKSLDDCTPGEWDAATAAWYKAKRAAEEREKMFPKVSL